MMPLAVGTTVAVLAVIGLVIGLVVLFVVIWLLNDVLAPLRRTSADVQDALTAPMLERGVPGTDQLGATRRLAESVPDLALAYLQKLSLSGTNGGASPAPAPAAAPAAVAPAPTAPAQTEADADAESRLPAWKRYRG
ncbi:MAG: hypothetical protein QOH83_1425 [Solirubrobacteraceae bacterium]|jgi:hypothetical protein|nr:hypothetical protein [Solirubrobacteraceae bacterium]